MKLDNRKKRRLRELSAYNLSLTAMFTALSVICLYLASILPVGRVILYFISSVFAACMMRERQILMAFLVFAASSLISLLIMPDRLMVLPYVLLFGHYGIGRYFIEGIGDKTAVFIVKLIYFDICMGAIYFLAYGAFISGFLATLPLWVLIVAAQVVFAVYEYVYARVLTIYEKEIRKRLLKTGK